jgi:hypothetical protein
MNFLRIGLAALQMAVADTAARWMDWLPIPIQELEPCIPSRRVRRRQAQAWFSTIEMPHDCDQPPSTRRCWLSHESHG